MYVCMQIMDEKKVIKTQYVVLVGKFVALAVADFAVYFPHKTSVIPPFFITFFFKLRITLTRKYQEHAIPTCILKKVFVYICFQRFSALISFSFLKMRNM